MSDSLALVLADLLRVLRGTDLDTLWTPYRTGDDLLHLVEELQGRATAASEEGWSQAKTLFGPTAGLQETAMASGFVDEYMRLAARFDALGS